MAQDVPENYVQLGKLGKTFQLKGGLHFYPLGDAEAEAILSLKKVFVKGVGEADVRNARAMGAKTILYLTRALSVEAARTLVNHDVYAAPDALPARDDNEIYIDELIGQTVFLSGAAYGQVLEILDADMQDVLKVETGARTIMIPLQAPYVEVTDDGIYLEDVPEGLLELNA